MNRVKAVLFAVLVGATVAAFFVAQRIKHSPSIIQSVRHATLISPNGDGRLDTIGFSLRLKHADRVTLTIVDADGDPVKTILDDHKLGAYTNLKGDGVRWDGRDSGGKLVPDGRYRLRITLRELGRSVIDTHSIEKDTTPPKPTITRVDPVNGPGPTILPRSNGGDVTAVFKRARAGASVQIFQTSPVVRRVLSRDIAPGTTQFSWNGLIDGARAAQGTYVVVARWRDEAGNFGTSIPLDKRGLPILRSPKLPGRGGITVRYLAASAPSVAVTAGKRATFGVDAGGARYRWSLRRAGGRALKTGRATRSPLTVKVPRADSGLYVLEVRSGNHAAQAPFVVNAARTQSGDAKHPRGVLVVVPELTWQGRNAVDDDGDGAPNLLDDGAPAQALESSGRQRAFAGAGLPVGFATHEVPLFAWLDAGHRYDVATDLQIEDDPGLLQRYRGAVLASDTRWLTTQQGSRIKRFVQGGGALLSLGTGSLRRTVDFSKDDGRLTSPSRPAAADLFGAKIGPVQQMPTGLEIFGADKAGLFGRTAGAISAVTGWEQTKAVGSAAEQRSALVTADTTPPGQTVTIAEQVGAGLVIRPGFDTFAARLHEPAVDGLMDGAWALLSR